MKKTAKDQAPREGKKPFFARLLEDQLLPPEQQRQVVVLRVWNGYGYAAIAQILGRAESTVRSNMFHALGSLRKYLEPKLRERE